MTGLLRSIGMMLHVDRCLQGALDRRSEPRLIFQVDDAHLLHASRSGAATSVWRWSCI
jgi:hypothetical protein